MKQVLVVDDERYTHRMLEDFLTRHFRCTVQAAMTVDEALTMVHSSPVDLVLLDLNMPGASSVLFVQTLKNDVAYATVPIIILSSMSFDQVRQVLKEKGADYFFSKLSLVDPHEQPQFLEVLGTYLPAVSPANP